MTTLKMRLQELMTEHGLKTQQELADFAGVTKGLVGQWFNGSTGLGAKPLMAFEKKTNFSTQWLIDGTGEKYKQIKTLRYAEFADRLAQSMAAKAIDTTVLSKKSMVKAETIEKYLQGNTLPRVEDAENLAVALNVSMEWLRWGENIDVPPTGSGVGVIELTNISDETHIRIKRYDVHLSAGEGNAVWVERENDQDPLYFRAAWFRAKHLNHYHLRAMYVRGDSMTPVLNHWDTVIIDINDLEIIDGDVYAVCFKGKLYIKQLRHTEDGISLISYNHEYQPINVTAETADKFQVLGRMVWRGG